MTDRLPSRHEKDQLSQTVGRTPLMFRAGKEIETLLCVEGCVAYTFVHTHQDSAWWPGTGWSHSYGCPVNGLWDDSDD